MQSISSVPNPNGFLLGCDPELFLTVGGKFISAHGLFPGSKNEPYKVNKGAIQVDGFALEFNIDPANNADDFSSNIQTVLSQMDDMVKDVLGDEAKLNFTPFAEFDPEYFASLPEESKVLGCDPDFNVSGDINPRPSIGGLPFRTAAGHIHIGWDNNLDLSDSGHFRDCQFVAKHFYSLGEVDLNQGRPNTELENKRLQFYGHQAFRPKTYGIELRQDSNLWVEHHETRVQKFNFVINEMNKIFVG